MFQKPEPTKIKLLTVQEAAVLLHRSPNTIRRLARDTKLDHVKIGKRIFIVEDSVEKFRSKNHIPFTPGPSFWKRIRDKFLLMRDPCSAYPDAIDTPSRAHTVNDLAKSIRERETHMKFSLIWKIKRLWHYLFGKQPRRRQYGSWGYEPIATVCEHTVRDWFAIHKVEVLEYQVLKSRANQNDPDPLSRESTYGWKVNVIEHTRKSWKSRKETP